MTSYLRFPGFNPVIFSIGSLSVYWYGFMYLIGFLFALQLAKRRVNKLRGNWTQDEVENLFYSGFLGVLLGGRIGYIIFYNLPIFFKNPICIFRVWEGGMSFHGGLIGVILVMLLFSYTSKKNFFQISDFIAPLIPFGLGMGRLGNFINGELWGRVSINNRWAMLFPGSRSQDIILASNHPKWQYILNQYGVLPRHPSQLYELFLEGILLFIILNILLLKKHKKIGFISGCFLISYGTLRIIVEFFREPDVQIGLFNGVISMGQILSIPMIIAGIIIMFWIYRSPQLLNNLK
ncbi:prolipoprotein diacylglyceryl transferase [Candidatus Profftia sp. (ex Adelges kitamiensis)]|uniref:prolipoprotein diacylglyceryl transferase n=1 Tax=Candidatus Profftia sp. (ex Adelges kitamiensis) TaxID=2864218 RepID=UPI001CE3403E|nr:prolipoprotein diacylglyceryl transferase [Candidatus Profftia sp. (ex Adelges kitamiensis)]